MEPSSVYHGRTYQMVNFVNGWTVGVHSALASCLGGAAFEIVLHEHMCIGRECLIEQATNAQEKLYLEAEALPIKW